MGLFGKSFEEKVQEAVDQVRRLGIKGLNAEIEGEVVTLTGEAANADLKAKAMQEFNKLVETENTFNRIRVTEVKAPAAPLPIPNAMPMAEAMPVTKVKPAEGPPLPPKPAERWHDVASGDTLSKMAKQYYGNATKYMKIFEANRDQLSNPDLIKVGQRLRIPE